MTHFINLDIQRRLTEIKNKIKNEIWYLGFVIITFCSKQRSIMWQTHDYIRMEITVLYLKIARHQLSIPWCNFHGINSKVEIA